MLDYQFSQPTARREFEVVKGTDDWISDLSGTIWHLSAKLRQLPDLTSKNKLQWQIRVDAYCKLGREELVKANVCEPSRDQRLLDFLGDEQVTIHCKGKTLNGSSGSEARRITERCLVEMKNKITGENFNHIKRKLLEQHINRRRQW